MHTRTASTAPFEMHLSRRASIPGWVSFVHNEFQVPIANGQKYILWGVNMLLPELFIQPG